MRLPTTLINRKRSLLTLPVFYCSAFMSANDHYILTFHVTPSVYLLMINSSYVDQKNQ
jgi:hypothetical protein